MVLFDIDGTLVDSNDAHASAWVDVLAEHGLALAHHDVRPLIGMGGDKLLPIGVATSAQKAEVRTLLRIAGADGLFDGAGSSDDVDRSKPEAARRAGVSCIALRCGGWWSDADFAGAVSIFDDPSSLLAHVRERKPPIVAA